MSSYKARVADSLPAGKLNLGPAFMQAKGPLSVSPWGSGGLPITAPQRCASPRCQNRRDPALKKGRSHVGGRRGALRPVDAGPDLAAVQARLPSGGLATRVAPGPASSWL